MIQKSTDIANHELLDDLEWARSDEVQQAYPGQLIAVCDRRVVANSTDRGDLLRQVQAAGYARDQVVIVTVLPAEFEVAADVV